MTGAVDKGDVTQELHRTTTPWPFARWVVLFVRWIRPVAARSWTCLVCTFVDLCICVTQLDRNVSHELVLEADRLHAGDCLDYCGLSVRYVANGTDVDRRLSTDDFWTEGSELGRVCTVRVRTIVASSSSSFVSVSRPVRISLCSTARLTNVDRLHTLNNSARCHLIVTVCHCCCHVLLLEVCLIQSGMIGVVQNPKANGKMAIGRSHRLLCQVRHCD